MVPQVLCKRLTDNNCRDPELSLLFSASFGVSWLKQTFRIGNEPKSEFGFWECRDRFEMISSIETDAGKFWKRDWKSDWGNRPPRSGTMNLQNSNDDYRCENARLNSIGHTLRQTLFQSIRQILRHTIHHALRQILRQALRFNRSFVNLAVCSLSSVRSENVKKLKCKKVI